MEVEWMREKGKGIRRGKREKERQGKKKREEKGSEGRVPANTFGPLLPLPNSDSLEPPLIIISAPIFCNVYHSKLVS